MVTIQQFDAIPDGETFAQGFALNDPDEIYMTDSRIGEELRWVAVKGYAHDWCIYCLWANESTFGMVERNGDKIRTREYILKLVPCDEEVYKLYRK